ncbi:MAG TPA: hypothetical protein ENK75_05860 [Saprospiraceae bacterium]|nr:hypothetical protein [Saprospiraceae bacterium]
MNWIYKSTNKEIKELYDFPRNAYGFIYMLIYDTNKAYIGQKSLYSYQTLPALKNGTQRPNSERIGKNKNGKRVYFDKVQKESNWKSYESSSKDIPKEVNLIEKKVLAVAYSKRELTYLETKYLFQYEVLESEDYYNGNILGKFYKGNIT